LKYLLYLLFVLNPIIIIAQSPSQISENLKALRLACLDDDISDELLKKNNALFKRTLKEVISSSSSTNLLDSIPFFSHLKSPDKVFDLFNWNVSYENGTFEYFCFLRINETNELVEFTDNSDKFYNPETKKLSPKDWFGALYFEIIPVKSKPNYYVLLGWDGNNDYTTKKVIESMTIEDSKINFGLTVFQDEDILKTRKIFEYSSKAVMSLRYDKKENLIIFDHLAPFQPGADDFFEFYGPDLSFDGFRLKKGDWIYEKNVDARAPNKMDNYLDPKRKTK